MSHPELVFPLGESGEAAALLGVDGLAHPEPIQSGSQGLAPDSHHYTVHKALAAWAGRLHQ